mgnify:CR=1 FL=1
MNIFFTSDPHWGHANILKYESATRKFDSIEEMDEVLIQNWNDKIKEKDEVYILGDLSFHKPNKTVEILKRLNGKKCLIDGNHDLKYLKHNEFIEQFDGRVFSILDHKINGKHYVMCHYPMMAWNRSHYGAINLFGHLHSNWKGNNKQLNVGVDVHNLSPICIDEIEGLLNSLPERNIELHS